MHSISIKSLPSFDFSIKPMRRNFRALQEIVGNNYLQNVNDVKSNGKNLQVRMSSVSCTNNNKQGIQVK